MIPPTPPATTLREQIEKLDCWTPADEYMVRLKNGDWLRRADVLQVIAARAEEPSITCPACGETVQQVSSATLSLALWQHWNWTCQKGAVADPARPEHE
jgi:hypothetical protein